MICGELTVSCAPLVWTLPGNGGGDVPQWHPGEAPLYTYSRRGQVPKPRRVQLYCACTFIASRRSFARRGQRTRLPTVNSRPPPGVLRCWRCQLQEFALSVVFQTRT